MNDAKMSKKRWKITMILHSASKGPKLSKCSFLKMSSLGTRTHSHTAQLSVLLMLNLLLWRFLVVFVFDFEQKVTCKGHFYSFITSFC